MEDTSCENAIDCSDTADRDDSSDEEVDEETQYLKAKKKNEREYRRRPYARRTKLSHKHYKLITGSEDFLSVQEHRVLQERYDCWFWPNGAVFRYEFLKGPHSAQFKTALRIEESKGWTYGANVGFERHQKRTETQRPTLVGVRIEIVECINSVADVGLNGAFTHSSDATMRLEMDNTVGPSRTTIRHELGHILGLQHEHQRYIRDIEFNEDLARPFLKTVSNPEHNVLEKRPATRIDPFEYYANSIMHYDFGHFGHEAFTSAVPHQPDKNWCRDLDITSKDRKLISYLYPLPAGGTITLKNITEAHIRLPKSKRQTIMLPHLWYTPCRVILGFQTLKWDPKVGQPTSLSADATSCCQRYFHLEGKGSNAKASVAYLAIDPSIVNVQTWSRVTFCEYFQLDPDGAHHVEVHRLRPNTSSKAKVVTWIRRVEIADASKNFDASIDTAIRLTADDKTLVLHHRSTQGVLIWVNWVVINRDAINIDGGHIHWHASDASRQGSVQFNSNMFDEWELKSPQVMTAMPGLKFSPSCDHSDMEVFFQINVNVSSTGFSWEIDMCHDHCFSELSFSWIVVPKPRLEPFGFPKGVKTKALSKALDKVG